MALRVAEWITGNLKSFYSEIEDASRMLDTFVKD
jgi:hypothetical protein